MFADATGEAGPSTPTCAASLHTTLVVNRTARRRTKSRQASPIIATAVVIDFDLHYPAAREKQRGVREVLQQAKRSVTAAFSRQLTEEEIENLREHGVVVSERLGGGLLAALAEEIASLSNRACPPTPVRKHSRADRPATSARRSAPSRDRFTTCFVATS